MKKKFIGVIGIVIAVIVGGIYYLTREEKIELSLIPKDSNTQLSSHKKLRKSYIWSKKIKLAVYKIIKFSR